MCQIMLSNPRGSIWHKWDLHVHTPASVVQYYGGDSDEAWEKFFTDIESLPDEFKVIGINDYIFIDGYRKVVEAHEDGRMKNIELFLPVIELRLDKFGQSGDKLSCVNYHIIFSNEVKPDDIQEQFLNKLSAKYNLSSALPECEVIAKRESLTKFGDMVFESTSENKKAELIKKSRLEIGFNNFHLSIETISNSLKSLCFQSKYLTAVGKAEWEDVRWGESGQGAAEKKTIVNNVDFVFTAAKTIEDTYKSKQSLTQQGVKNLLFDCSDAHYFSNHPKQEIHNRIGKCFTWIKADLTFEGLKMVLKEPEERCCLVEKPDVVSRVEYNKTKYIRSISIRKTDDSDLHEVWFDNITISFNHGLVAIIGNKGNGKSALTDIVALLSNYRGDFSFLSKEKFRNPKDHKAKHFEGCLTWEDGNSAPFLKLSENTGDENLVRVKYIPQDFFERVCNETNVSATSEFGQQLKDVIFSHVPHVERNNRDSLDELISYRTSEINISLDSLRAQLREINRNIVEYERQVAEEHRQDITQKLRIKQQELEAHKQSQPLAIDKPETSLELQSTIRGLQEQVAVSEVKIQGLDIELGSQNNLKIQIEKAFSKLDNFKREYEKFKNDWDEEFGLIKLKASEIVELKFHKENLVNTQDACEVKVAEIKDSISMKGDQKEELEKQIKVKREELNEPEKKYQNYLSAMDQWQGREKEIIGSASEHGSIEYYKDLLEKSNKDVPLQLSSEKIKRLNKSKDIFRHIQKIAAVHKDLYRPVQEFVDSNEVVKNDYKLTFEVSIIINKFDEKFFDYVNQSVKGTFRGATEGRNKLCELLEASNFDQEMSIEVFLDEITERLEFEDKQPGKAIKIEKQLKSSKTPEDFYNFLFALEYLEPSYTLKLSGKEIKQLSPGERGALLLIFYLLIDNSDIPIIIDQPEHNLDSESVYKLLLPCVRKAKKRRQLFMITHNPNLAVVCDAEQVIYSEIDKENGNLVKYISGAIENPEIRQKVIDVLEGTLPAFNNRESKYQINR